jgi:hypothetical protein
MIRWIRISSYKEIIRSKLTWLLLGLCLVTLLAIVIWPKEAKKESISTEEVEEPKDAVLAEVPETQQALEEEQWPQQWPPDEPEEVELDILKILQGVVTGDYDPCTQLVTVEGLLFYTGPVDLSGILPGDVVKVYYTENKSGGRKVNVLKSLELIAASQQRTAQSVIPYKKPFREPQKQEENEEFTEEEPLGKPEEAVGWEELTEEEPSEESEEVETDVYPKTIKGRVTYIETCAEMIYVDGISFQPEPGSVDWSGIRIGDVVEITYTKNKYGKKVLESSVVIESRH